MALWGDIAAGGLNAYGYTELLDNLKNTQGDLNSVLSGLQAGIDERTQFTPWGVTSSIGNIGVDNQGMNFNLSPQQQAMQAMLGQGAQDVLGRAAVDPTQRQNELFGLLRDSKAAQDAMNYEGMMGNLYGRGRTGVTTTTYGGSPEQYAFAKARENSMSQDMLAAQQMALQESANQAQLGNTLFQNQYMPQQQLAQLANYGINNQQLNNTMQREGTSLWAQLGLGGLSSNVNLENIRGKAFGDMIAAATPLARSAGDALGDYDWAGLWDTVGGWFKK